MTPQIRRMRHGDIRTVHNLEKLIFPDAWPLSSFVQEVDNVDISHPCVLLLDGEIVAYAVAWYFALELHITNIAVHPDQRRTGLAGLLLNYLMQTFPDWQTAFLEVRRSNLPAISLYRSFGFTELGIRKGYYTDGEDALVMENKNNNTHKE
jgi:ribosomal-protein-alanine N-acetyltransferase